MSGTLARRVTTPQVPEPPAGLFSNCLVVGDTVYISGQHAGLPGGGTAGDGTVLDQARHSLRKVIALVEAAGGSAEVSTARREFFGDPFPCSTLVGITALVAPELKVEIDAVAVLNAGQDRGALQQ